jgi:hypothetical protein
MPPAIRPAESWSEARVGPSNVVTGTSNFSGSAPYLRLLASDIDEAWVKLPLITAEPLTIGESTVGAESTLPSRTTAKVFCCWVSGLVWLAIAVVTVANVLRPEPLKVRSTVQVGYCWPGATALALLSSVPSMTGADSRYFTPSASQVTSGWVLLSSGTAPAFAPVGQV